MQNSQVIFFAILLVGVHGLKTVYKMDIGERGTRFNESVEIDNEKKTVVYKVPAHNDIDKSETLLDYESGVIATRISASKECYIQPIPPDESSLTQTKKNLKLREYLSKNNETIPVKTLSRVLVKERRIPRRELSRKVSSFCSGRRVYIVKERSFEDVFGSEVEYDDDVLDKRSSMRVYTFYVLSNNIDDTGVGIRSCKRLRDYGAFSSCPKVKYGCKKRGYSCRYVAYCKPAQGDFIPGDDGNLLIEMKCKEEHKFTADFCCDVLCA